jgi:hypothetical protein
MKGEFQMFRISLILVMMIVFCISACNSPSESSANNKPEIREISYSPLPVKAQNWTYFTAVATDKDGDNITYYWSCSAGEFFPGDSDKNPTRWKVMSAGKYTISCTASDGKDTSRKSVSVDVVP